MKSFSHVALLKKKAQSFGGLEKYASRIANAFVQKGAHVSILTTENGDEPGSNEISVHRIQTVRWPQFIRLEQFDKGVESWVHKNTPDLIFGMDRNRFQTHIRAGNGVHRCYLKSRTQNEGKLKYQTSLLNPLHRKILSLEKEAFENPHLEKVFANSNMVREQILKNFSIEPNIVEVIHNGVEWEEMEIPFSETFEVKDAIGKDFGLNPKSYHFLFIGNGYMRKGLVSLLKALSFLKKEDFFLSVVGKDKEIYRFKRMADDLGIGKNVHFFGPQKKITPFYQVADCLVIPSFYDPFANVTIEALAMGLFVLSSKQNGGHEILTRSNGGLIEDLMDIHSFSKTLQECLNIPKTAKRAESIRNSVQYLDFSTQLDKLILSCG